MQRINSLSHRFFDEFGSFWAVAEDFVVEFSLLVLNTESHLIAKVQVLRKKYGLSVCFDGLVFGLYSQFVRHDLGRIMCNITYHEVEQCLFLIFGYAGQTFSLNHLRHELVLVINFLLNFFLINNECLYC